MVVSGLAKLEQPVTAGENVIVGKNSQITS
jgi:hypothetical protein